MELDLLGRAGVWGELTALLEPGRAAGPAVLLAGPAGIGKTLLVERFAGHAAAAGHRVLRGGGESGGASYATLRGLFGGCDTGELPDGQRRALRAALDGPGERVDLLALRAAVCALCAVLASDRPDAAERQRREGGLSVSDRVLVLVVDDVDRVDAASLDLLLTLASVISWRQLPVVAVFASRTERVPVELAELVRQIPVPPLDDRAAEQLLDRLGAPAGAARLEILRRSAGNPLALHEYGENARLAGGPRASRAGSPRAEDTRSGEAERAGLFGRRVAALPETSLRALTLAAAGERSLAVVARADPAMTPAVWRPAEEAGLITVVDGAVRFRHPLVEYAVLEAAGAEPRRRAHRMLAAATADPQRALWHRAEATDGTDAGLAEELIAAARTLDGAAAVTAVGLLERACDLLPADRRAPVLVEAAGRAAAVGRVRWAAGIAQRARQGQGHPEPSDQMIDLQAWALTMAGRADAAAELLVPVLRRASSGATPTALTETAGLPAFLLGDGPLTEALRDAIAVPRPAADRQPERELFPRALVAADERLRRAILRVPEPVTPREVGYAAAAGAGAMLIDEPEHAIRLLGAAVRAVADGTATGVFLTATGAAGWSLIDTGRWVEAEQLIVPLLSSPVMAEAAMVRTGARVQLAVIAAGRGRPVSPTVTGTPAFDLRLRWAQGVAAAGAGDHEEAYRLLRGAVDLPHPWRVLILPDLVAAALHTGHADEAGELHARFVSAYAKTWSTERKRRQMAAAGALLAPEPGVAAARLTEIVTSPDAARHPFERAVLAVELADRLRRAQQPSQARDVLVGALDTFERLHATTWAARVRGDLRTGAPTAPDLFAALTAQQEQIIRLAARGLTNREIGERLFLSPRTVGSHLYRIFPLLGVANRTQLGDLVRGSLLAPEGTR
ncbi:AAA family ATPase [Actinoplanes sp. NPDC051851]|uniref:helix-turn-helix transcriptional regulator n=1 Tax=Actinoplanes sp. NPDC051851 TaxID=3154753 RepID=UPI00341F253B